MHTWESVISDVSLLHSKTQTQPTAFCTNTATATPTTVDSIRAYTSKTGYMHSSYYCSNPVHSIECNNACVMYFMEVNGG